MYIRTSALCIFNTYIVVCMYIDNTTHQVEIRPCAHFRTIWQYAYYKFNTVESKVSFPLDAFTCAYTADVLLDGVG